MSRTHYAAPRTKSNRKLSNPSPSIQLVRDGNLSAVVADGTKLMEFHVGDLFMAGNFEVRHVRFRKDSPARMRHINASWMPIVPSAAPMRVRITST